MLMGALIGALIGAFVTGHLAKLGIITYHSKGVRSEPEKGTETKHGQSSVPFLILKTCFQDLKEI